MIHKKYTLFLLPFILPFIIACGGENIQPLALVPNAESAVSEENLSQTPFLNPDISLDFTTNQENNISVKTATISFASGSFTESLIHIDASYHDSNITTDTPFPANFKALENNQTFPINSYGFFRIQLKDSEGKKATLLKDAKLFFPITKEDSNPQTLSLWHYDASLKAWQASATATLNETQDAYEAEVSHFTYWSIGERKIPARYKSCLQDTNGTMIENATLALSTRKWYSLTKTNNKGLFDFTNILADEQLLLSIFVDGTEMHQVLTPLLANEVRENRECIVFKVAQESGTRIISGHLLDEHNQTIPNATVTLNINGTNDSTLSDSNGTFSFSLNDTLLNGVDTFRITAIKPADQLSGTVDITTQESSTFRDIIIQMSRRILF